jgi:uncharacterized protein (TIGR02452 family)
MNIQLNDIYFKKYLNYKSKYLGLINQQGGALKWHYYTYNLGYVPFSDADSQFIDKRITERQQHCKPNTDNIIMTFIRNRVEYRIHIDCLNKNKGTQTNIKTGFIRKILKIDDKKSSRSYRDYKRLPKTPTNYNETTQRSKESIDFVQFRKEVMIHTTSYLSTNTNIQKQSMINFKGWKKDPVNNFKLIVKNKDWGTLTQDLTKEYGQIFAVLNMANGEKFGGGYIGGAKAQEENIFRRTNCSLYYKPTSLKHGIKGIEYYDSEMSNLINGVNNKVYLDLDMKNIRVCFKGNHNEQLTVYYPLLENEQFFPFYELRAAAVNLYGKSSNFDQTEMTKRIRAQFETLKEQNIRYVILSAFGCGAFGNPANEVCKIYHDLILKYIDDFNVIAFAIINAGNDVGLGGNFEVFYEGLKDISNGEHQIVIKRNSKIDKPPPSIILSDKAKIKNRCRKREIESLKPETNDKNLILLNTRINAKYETIMKELEKPIETGNIIKKEHWIWWVFPTEKPGENELGFLSVDDIDNKTKTNITKENAYELFHNQKFIDIHKKIFDLIENGHGQIIFPSIDHDRIKYFNKLWYDPKIYNNKYAPIWFREYLQKLIKIYKN